MKQTNQVIKKIVEGSFEGVLLKKELRSIEDELKTTIKSSSYVRAPFCGMIPSKEWELNSLSSRINGRLKMIAEKSSV